ncbi:hypothetical protein BN8_03692 [Fibrisoma limi BUZ 3]|uniref:Uncharacterized protein n=1 Tax=Fibrisoma limi BUZ 3 TaxID=1185876 RepID=I2GKT8_9BACT|nr:hypothetical protein [Fibrisoma limi]CCH54514.1 hypothetical protein BN8_03692 [Fibrisoma limi BUZ 3]
MSNHEAFSLIVQEAELLNDLLGLTQKPMDEVALDYIMGQLSFGADNPVLCALADVLERRYWTSPELYREFVHHQFQANATA